MRKKIIRINRTNSPERRKKLRGYRRDEKDERSYKLREIDLNAVRFFYYHEFNREEHIPLDAEWHKVKELS